MVPMPWRCPSIEKDKLVGVKDDVAEVGQRRGRRVGGGGLSRLANVRLPGEKRFGRGEFICARLPRQRDDEDAADLLLDVTSGLAPHPLCQVARLLAGEFAVE